MTNKYRIQLPTFFQPDNGSDPSETCSYFFRQFISVLTRGMYYRFKLRCPNQQLSRNLQQ